MQSADYTSFRCQLLFRQVRPNPPLTPCIVPPVSEHQQEVCEA
jgi:hypothetical protein